MLQRSPKTPVTAPLRVHVPGPLDLESTLYSGQAFRWTRGPGPWHTGFIANVPCRVRSQDGTLIVEAGRQIDANVVAHYFRLDGAHEEFLRTVRRDEALEAALARFVGLRLLRQDPWEMLISFIVSQNSNEAKIRRSIEGLCRHAGEPTEFGGETRWRFPKPTALARLDEATLRSTGLGYRARFIRGAAQEVAHGRLDPLLLADMPYEEAFDRLMQLDGVGAKVADCILLYGCDHQDAFPSDVWVRRFLRETYLRRSKDPNHLRIREFALRHFGPYAGYAQHYLFHYRRSVGALAKTS